MSPAILYAISGWLIRAVMVPVVTLRKANPTVCLAWLSVIFLSPWLGLALYLLLGESRLGRRRLKRRSRMQRLFDVGELQPEELPAHANPSVREDHALLARLAERHGGLTMLGDNAVEFLSDGATLERLVADIDKAQHHVHLLFYIFAEDDAGRSVSEALARAAERGVQCRVLVDAVGSRDFLEDWAGQLRDKGVSVVPCLPVSLLRLRLARMDIRNHRKLAVIDGLVGYAGSQNIVNPSFGHPKAGSWRDIMARTSGPVVSNLQMVFVQDWFYETGETLDAPELFPRPEQQGHAAVQLVPTGPDQPTEGFQDLMVLAIQSARKKVCITSPYFVPDEGLVMAMRLAAARGVDIDLIVPDRSDHILVDAVTHYHCATLLTQDVKVHLFQGGLLHAKTMTVDDSLSMVGSANFDIRSFTLNLELVLFLYDDEANSNLRRLQDSYREGSLPLTREEWDKRPAWRQLGDNMAKVLSPLL